jgi:hypothetical protein
MVHTKPPISNAKSASILTEIEEAWQLILADQESPNFLPAINKLYVHLGELGKDENNLPLIHEVYWRLKFYWEQTKTPKQFYAFFNKEGLEEHFGPSLIYCDKTNHFPRNDIQPSTNISSPLIEACLDLMGIVSGQAGKEYYIKNAAYFNKIEEKFAFIRNTFKSANKEEQGFVKAYLKYYLAEWRAAILAIPMDAEVLMDKYPMLWQTVKEIFDINFITSFWDPLAKDHEEFLKMMQTVRVNSTEREKIKADIVHYNARFLLEGDNYAKTCEIMRSANLPEDMADLNKIYDLALKHKKFEIVHDFLTNTFIVQHAETMFNIHVMDVVHAIPANADLRIPYYAAIINLFSEVLKNQDARWLEYYVIRYCKEGVHPEILRHFIESPKMADIHGGREPRTQPFFLFLKNPIAERAHLRAFLNNPTLKIYPYHPSEGYSPFQIALLNNHPPTFVIEFLKDARLDIGRELWHAFSGLKKVTAEQLTDGNLPETQFVIKLIAALVLRFAIEEKRILPKNEEENQTLFLAFIAKEEYKTYFAGFNKVFQTFEGQVFAYFNSILRVYSPPSVYEYFALQLLYTNGHLQVKAPEPNTESANLAAVEQVFKISSRLPLDLQIIFSYCLNGQRP